MLSGLLYFNKHSFYLRLLLSTVFWGLSQVGWAISNIESDRVAEPEDGWSGKVDISFSGKSGNSESENYKLGGRAYYQQKKQSVLGLLSGEYGRSFKVKNTDNDFAHLRYIYRESERFKYEFYLQQQSDAFKQLESRRLIGGGVRWQLFGEGNISVNLGLGGYYTFERYRRPGAADAFGSRSDYARWSSYIVFKQQLNANSYITNITYIQPRISQLSDRYGYNNFALTTKVSTRVSMSATLRSEYDSNPFGDVKTTDHNYNVSLAYEFD